VETEDLVVDQGGKGEVVEEIGKVLPDICVAVLAQALVVEAVDLGDLTGLVVTAKDGDALWVANLQGDEQCHSLYGEITAINVIACMEHVSVKSKSGQRTGRRTHEEVVGVGVGASDLEELHQIVELAVDISADGDRTFLSGSSVSSSAWLSGDIGRKDIRQAGHWTRPGEPLLPFRTVSGHRLLTAACRPSSSQSSRRGTRLRAGQRAPS
jgi:hypothetical protein